MQAANGFENRADAATEFVVMTIVEALEINFIKINPRANVFEHLWRTVAIRHECSEQTSSFGLFEDGHRPFSRD